MTKPDKAKNGFILGSIAFIFIVFLAVNADAKIAFNNNCPLSAADNVNFSNGTAVFLPFTYNETNTSNSNLTIFLGTNTTYFCNSINLTTFASNRKVIFTPEFLNALKTSSCSATFEAYMQSFRKSGDILNSSGTLFCGLRNVTVTNVNSTGITFDFIYTGNLGVDSNAYNGSQLKRYALAYLINNPAVALSGIVSTFANAIGLNFSAACPDAGTVSAFFNSAKGNYTEIFKPRLLGMNLTIGEQLKPSNGVGGVFGWLLNFALGNQTMPVVTAMNLSTNKIYICGLIQVEDYTNSTITTVNNATTVNATAINTTLEIRTNASVVNSTIDVVRYNENPRTSGVVGVTALNKYIGIRMDSSLKNVLSYVIIRVYYTDTEVSNAGLNESTLRLYYYNETSSSWVKYDSPNGGVDTSENYVWANTTHFSDWGIFGNAPAAASAGTTASGSGGFTAQKSCGSWSSCANGRQTRECVSSGSPNAKFIEERACIAPSVTEKQKIIPQPEPLPAQEPQAPSLLVKITPPAVPLGAVWFSLIAIVIILAVIAWKMINKKVLILFIKKKKKKKKK